MILGLPCLTPGRDILGIPHSHGGTPITGWSLLGQIPSKCTRTGGTPISGHLHIPVPMEGTKITTLRVFVNIGTTPKPW